MELKKIHSSKPNKRKSANKQRTARFTGYPYHRQRSAKEYKSAYRKPQSAKGIISGRPIVSLLLGLGLVSAILLVTMFTSGADAKSSQGSIGTPPGQAQETDTAGEPDDRQLQEILGVLTGVDTQAKEVTIYDVASRISSVYQYTGATSILDKYGQQMAASQLEPGTMVEAGYPRGQAALAQLKLSTKAWEYIGVNNLSVNTGSKVMKIGSRKYKFTDDLFVLDGESFVPVSNLAEQDELTVWGYEETIWAITVTRGHGTVKILDCDSYLGDFITIGYEAIRQIAQDMIITVREGSFNLTVENTGFTATKRVTVYRNKETAVSLADLGPDASKVGRVTFVIAPFGADLFVDGKYTSYANPLELTYGIHDIVVSLGGYTTYEGKLTVDTAGKTIRISLPEESSEEEADVTETDTSAGADVTGTDGPTGTDTSSGTGTVTGEDTAAGESSSAAPGYDSSGGSSGTGSDEELTSDTENVSNDDFEPDENHLIYVQNPIGASVYLNGEFMCTSPGSFTKLIGTHVLTFIKEGYQTVSYTVEVADDGLDVYFNMPDMVKKK